MSDRVVTSAERVRAAVRGLACSRSEALALAVLVAGGCAGLLLLWSLADGGARRAEPQAVAGPAEHASAGHDAPADGGNAPPGAGEHGGAGAGGYHATGATAPATVVYVSGLVAHPGVYDLPGGARVADALTAAGGPLPEARLDGLNLARVVVDGEQVHVPGPDDAVVPSGEPAVSSAWLPDGRLDINRATQAEFEELPGIGPVLAERIVAHRDELGGFESIGDLLGVRGIGEKTLAALADLLAP